VAILDSTTPVFDQAASQGSSTEGPGLGDACNQYGDQISILESEFEGVPHPYAWYSKAGWMHHSFAGVYHEMLGALQECQTAVSNQDDGALASAVSVMAAADGEMRQDDSYAHWLSKQG